MTSKVTIIKHVCDRCGNSEEFKVKHNIELYPKDWQHVELGQTGATLDLCDECNTKLYEFLKEEGATNMSLACFRDKEVF